MDLTVIWLALRVLLILAFVITALLITTIALNHPPLFDPPGFKTRLKTYFTTHTAELREDHPFPELRTWHDRRSPENLLNVARQAAQSLGWSVELEPDTGLVHAVVSTPLWKFKDDVYIKVHSKAGGSVLSVRSESRVGRADLAANSRHVLDLLAAMDIPVAE